MNSWLSLTQSIRVPRRVVRKLSAVVQWVSPVLLTALLGWLIVVRDWIKERVSATYQVTEAIASAHGAEEHAHHAAVLADAHQLELVALWANLVELHAELLVQRSYSQARNRGELIEAAKTYYRNAYKTEREQRPNAPPSESAERVLRTIWRPER